MPTHRAVRVCVCVCAHACVVYVSVRVCARNARHEGDDPLQKTSSPVMPMHNPTDNSKADVC